MSDDEGDGLQLEGRSTLDRAWYDGKVTVRSGSLFLRFDGYSTDEEEPLQDLDSIRFSSLAAEPDDCPHVVPGTLITGFKRASGSELWIDAEVVGKKAGKHEGGKCHCSFTVKWLDTADSGKQADLRIGDICLRDPRSINQHPQYQQYLEVLERSRRAAAGRAAAASAMPTQQLRRPCAVPESPGAISDSGGEESEEEEAAGGGASGLGQQQAPPPVEFLLCPPGGASGPPCVLCKLLTMLPGDRLDLRGEVREEFGALQAADFTLHHRCAAWSVESGLQSVSRYETKMSVPRALLTSFAGGVRSVQCNKCAECGEPGAPAKCSKAGCKKYFHLHCSKKCKVDAVNWQLLCPGHSVLSNVPAVNGGSFYGGRSASARHAELEGMRQGRLLGPMRLGALKRKGTFESDPVRRSSRNQEKRIRYGEGQMAAGEFMQEGWQKKMLQRARRGSGSGSDDSQGDDGIQYQDDSDGDNFTEDGIRRNPGRRGKQARLEQDSLRKTGRQRTQVKSYAEEQEELELKMEAYRLENAQKSGYEDARCQICAAKSRAKDMLLCDGCDNGYHMFCLTPPLAKAPLASWYCKHCLEEQDCETCGQAVAGKRGKKQASAKDLQYCSTCGALCHAGCMQEQEGGELRCTLCIEGLQDVEAILGCRPQPQSQHQARQYYVKFKERSYRRCRWITERAVVRVAPSQLQRFTRDSRDADNVEPNVQAQWMQVERVVSTRTDAATGQQLCLVKWRGLEYDKATWEPRQELKDEKQALQKFERRMALRVERDGRAEEKARKVELAPLTKQPAFLKSAGTLKDYQLEGISWVMSKLQSNLSVILGDEMGLGKTIQTAVFLQLAQEQGLTTGPVAVVVPLSTFGSWEREMAKWAPGLEVLSYSGPQEARALIRKYELGTEEDAMDAVRRKATSLNPRFHVMLTTYDVVIRDVAVLKRFDWSAMVIDEGHSLKGQDSLRGRMLREMGAPWRMLLTGTPLQNNLRELLVLLAFMSDCKVEDIERKVQRLTDPNPPPLVASAAEDVDEELAQAQAYIRKLHMYLEPRMLRRMKAVCLAGQMPPKITRKVACRMTPLQLQLYADVLAKDWGKVNAMVRNRLEKKSMNNILIRLRQSCNHPYLLPGQEPEEYKNPETPEMAEEGWRLMVAASGKLTLLQQLLPRLLADGHRVLIFSQYVEMLDILEDFLHDFQDPSGLLPQAEEDGAAGAPGAGGAAADAAISGSERQRDGSAGVEGSGDEEKKEEGEVHDDEEEEDFVRGRAGSAIRYFRLDGKSKGWQRQAMMDSFNSLDCKVKVFLISTRAGSLGINLQTADTVILYDPDFNPFVDAQAEGRAHRLGQESTVMVYQLYTASSVEERILELAAKKRKLEELVTKHLGKSRDVSDEDIKSSVFYGWGNLMRQAGEDGKADADLALSEGDLVKLLDREHVFSDDLASGADAATLLGEVRAGQAAAMTFEDGGSGEGEAGDGGGGVNGGKDGKAGPDAAMEAAMMRLIQERARKYEEDTAAKEDLGRGRRARGTAQNYDEEQDGLKELLSDEDSPEKKVRKAGGSKRPRPASSQDTEYDPTRSPGLQARKGSGENAQPNAADLHYSSDSGSESDSEAEREQQQAQQQQQLGGQPQQQPGGQKQQSKQQRKQQRVPAASGAASVTAAGTAAPSTSIEEQLAVLEQLMSRNYAQLLALQQQQKTNTKQQAAAALQQDAQAAAAAEALQAKLAADVKSNKAQRRVLERKKKCLEEEVPAPKAEALQLSALDPAEVAAALQAAQH